MKHFLKDDIKTMSDKKYISNANEVSFLGLTLDSALSWKKHIDKLTGKLCSACYALRRIWEVVSKDILKSVHFAHIHSLLSYGIIFRGNSAHAKKIFIIKKKSIKIITKSKPTDSCTQHFINLEIMTMNSQYIYSLMVHTVQNQQIYAANNDIHNYRTRYNKHLHFPIVNLKRCSDAPHYSAMKIYTHLPEYINVLTLDLKSFKRTLRGSCVSIPFIPCKIIVIRWVTFHNLLYLKKIIIYKRVSYFGICNFGSILYWN